MGLVAALECWDIGSVPGLAQWVKDLVLPQLQQRSQLQLESDPWPRNSTCCEVAQKKKKKKKLYLNTLVVPINKENMDIFQVCKPWDVHLRIFPGIRVILSYFES